MNVYPVRHVVILALLSAFNERFRHYGGLLWTEGLLFTLHPFAYRQLLGVFVSLRVCVLVCVFRWRGVEVGYRMSKDAREKEKEIK